MPGRTPASAPRCPKCGYLLYGAPTWRCPECGHESADGAERNRAYWRADDNVVNRRAVLAEWLAAGIGAALLLFSVGSSIWMRQVRLVPLWVITFAVIYHRWRMREPMFGLLLGLGAVWFVLEFLLIVA